MCTDCNEIKWASYLFAYDMSTYVENGRDSRKILIREFGRCSCRIEETQKTKFHFRMSAMDTERGHTEVNNNKSKQVILKGGCFDPRWCIHTVEY